MNYQSEKHGTIAIAEMHVNHVVNAVNKIEIKVARNPFTCDTADFLMLGALKQSLSERTHRDARVEASPLVVQILALEEKAKKYDTAEKEIRGYFEKMVQV